MDCFICRKHKNLDRFTGEVLAERGGLILTHFPKLDDERTVRGHLLIEPKRHITDFTELNEEEASALGPLIREGSTRVKSELGAEHVYVFRINDKVPHLHFHLVPRYPGTPKEYWGYKITQYPDAPVLKTLDEIKRVF